MTWAWRHGFDDRTKGYVPAYVCTSQGHMMVRPGSELDLVTPDPDALEYAAEYVKGWDAAGIADRVAP